MMVENVLTMEPSLFAVVMDIMEVKVDQQLAAIQQQQAATGAAKA